VPDRAVKLQKIFGETVRAERQARKLTQEQLAEKAELSLNFIGNLERGEKMPSLETVERLASALGLKGAELLASARL
jgi:transcriptional regulator with XRE-family HTH domain